MAAARCARLQTAAMIPMLTLKEKKGVRKGDLVMMPFI